MINLLDLIDSNKCFELVRLMRWGETVTCLSCVCTNVIKQGFDETQPERQRYKCKHCQFRFDDLTGTIFAGHHKPLEDKDGFCVDAQSAASL